MTCVCCRSNQIDADGFCRNCGDMNPVVSINDQNNDWDKENQVQFNLEYLEFLNNFEDKDNS